MGKKKKMNNSEVIVCQSPRSSGKFHSLCKIDLGSLAIDLVFFSFQFEPNLQACRSQYEAVVIPSVVTAVAGGLAAALCCPGESLAPPRV